MFINESWSNLAKINAGVPQGSVLGPILFVLIINDITDNLMSMSRLFTDDTSLIISISADPIEIQTNLNNDLHELYSWAENWQVTFNPNKTKAMFISNVNSEINLNLMFNGTKIDIVNNHKHLGVTLSANGKWTEHINNICVSTPLKQLGALRGLKFTLDKRTLNKMYHTFILPL